MKMSVQMGMCTEERPREPEGFPKSSKQTPSCNKQVRVQVSMTSILSQTVTDGRKSSTERALQILASPSKFLKGQPEPPPLPPRLARGGPDLIAGSQVVAEEESLESIKTSVDQGERSRTPDAVSGYAYLSQPVADATGNDAAGEDRDFVELVEYLKNVRLDSYASRLRRVLT